MKRFEILSTPSEKPIINPKKPLNIATNVGRLKSTCTLEIGLLKNTPESGFYHDVKKTPSVFLNQIRTGELPLAIRADPKKLQLVRHRFETIVRCNPLLQFVH